MGGRLCVQCKALNGIWGFFGWPEPQSLKTFEELMHLRVFGDAF